MRPLRAFAGVLALAAAWLWTRIPTIRADYARLTARPAQTASHRPPGPQLVAWLSSATALSVRVPRRVAVATRPAVRAASPPPAPTRTFASVEPVSMPPTMMAAVAKPSPSLPAPPPPGETEAVTAYRALAAGERRQAALAFRQALAAAPDDARAPVWQRQLASIEKRWSLSAYSSVRGGGQTALSVAPVLGGGQSGAQVAYAFDPLSRRPASITGRITAPNDALGDGVQAAVGFGWRISPAISIAGERLVRAGPASRGSWTARVAGGGATAPGEGRWRDASAYGEAGVVGSHQPALYAAVQGRVGVGFEAGSRLTVTLGAGLWSSLQRDHGTASRAELGPVAHLRVGHFDLAADYRVRVAGNSRPGSGPALTLAAYF